MKKFLLHSFLYSFFITLVVLFLSHSFLKDWQILLIIFFILFVSFYFSYLIIKKQIEHTLLNLVYQKIKKLLQNTENQAKQIHSIDEIDKIITDIETERKKEQSYFKNSDSYRKEYLGNVSHELKTPLFNVQGYISTLLDGGMDDKEILVEYLKKADKNTERMMNIIDDLETISQLESGAMILDCEKFDIEQLVNEVFEQMELSAKTKGIQLKLNKESSGYLFVNADKYRIRQVLINLISNSIKYGKENGNTIVSLKKEKYKIIVSISDDGIGIDEVHLPRIFERFYRVDKGRSREQGGTGLGLAIVKHIIEAHKQSISVHSQLGKGTAFTFSLESE